MVSSASLRQLRIKDEDLLTPDDLHMMDLDGQWIRTRAYEKGHRLAPDGETAYCGRPLAVSEDWWRGFRSWFERIFDEDPGEWFIAIDRRKEQSRCAPCKPKNAMSASKFDESEVVARYVEKTEPARFIPQSPAERAQHIKFMSRVVWVARELGAELQ